MPFPWFFSESGEVAFSFFHNFFGSRVFVRSDLVGSDEEGSG
jgi:hypothetical protein